MKTPRATFEPPTPDAETRSLEHDAPESHGQRIAREERAGLVAALRGSKLCADLQGSHAERELIERELIDAILAIFGRRRAMDKFPPHPSKTACRESLRRLSKLTANLRDELEKTPAEAELFMGGSDARGNNIYIATQFRLKDFAGIVDRALAETGTRKVGAPRDTWSWLMVEELVLMLQDLGLPISADPHGILVKILDILLTAVGAKVSVETVTNKLRNKGLLK